MQFLDLDFLYVIVITLTLERFLQSKSNLSTLVTVCLVSFLSYCFFENTLSLFPPFFYFLKNPLFCFFLFLKESFASFKEFFSFTGNQIEEKDVGADQSVRMEKSGNQAESKNPLPIEKSVFDEEKTSVREAGTTLNNQLPSPSTPGSPTLLSPLEEAMMDKDRRLAFFGISLGVMLALCQTCVGVLRRLRSTQEFVERIYDKGWPKWLFSWISNPNPEPFPEKWLFDLLVLILILNLIILYALFNTL